MTRLRRPALAIAALIGVWARSPATATVPQTQPDRFAAVRDTIRQVMADQSLASVSVAVAHGGTIVWEESFGWADRERRIPATPHTPYSLASITKPFTATGLMILVERGAIGLDRAAGDYLAPTARFRPFAGRADDATVARLLTHTAGLPLHFQFFYADDGYGPPPMDTTVARYAILVSPPGETYTYSNLGFGILDHVIGRVSGRDYATFLDDEVFRPLGLSHTAVDTPPGAVDSAAVRYLEDGTPLPPYTFDHVGASAIYASAHDLVRFGMFHLGEPIDGGRPILRPETIRNMQASLAPAEAPGLARGLGWAIVEDDNGLRRVYHTGSMPGVSTILNLYPEERLVVVVLMNGYSPPSRGRIADRITAALVPRFAQRLKSRPAATPPPTGFHPAAWNWRWTGSIVTYQDSVPFMLKVGLHGDVTARVGDQPEQLLDQVSYANGVLIGRYQGRLPTQDAGRHPHSLLVNLRLRARELTGFVAAIDAGPRGHFALSSWASLSHK